jgi:predicted small secreted protein
VSALRRTSRGHSGFFDELSARRAAAKGNIDMKTSTALVVALVVCALAGIGALACNTVKGSGRVVEKGGAHVYGAAGQNAIEHPRPHTITASAETGGSISPAGGTRVPRGSSQTFTATANTGYRVADLLVDGRSVGALSDLYRDNSSSYTFKNVAANHVISALFDLNETL